MEMNTPRWEATNHYLEEVFGRLHADDPLSLLDQEARAAGLPDISIGPVVGRLLMMLTSMTPGRLAVEVGTLGGYSAIWIARGLSADGRLITIEKDPAHADFAVTQFHRAQLQDRIELRQGAALDLLPRIATEVGDASIDLLFLDADKTEYPAYWEIARPLIAPGGLALLDNALGSGEWWIDAHGHPAREAADQANRMIASDPDFQTVAFPLRQGLLVARRMW